MGFLDRLLGREEPQQPSQAQPNNSSFIGTQPFNPTTQSGAQPTPQQLSDQQALARYRYMLQSAPPEALEQAHQEAFAQLTPEQRQMVLQQLAQNTPDNERAQLNDDPRSLARAATRAEIRQPGFLERSFGGMGGGGMGGGGMGGGMMGGMGGMMAGSLLTSIAGGFIGSSIANSFFNHPAVAQDYAQSDMAQGASDTNFNDNGGMSGTDASMGDYDSSGPGLTSNDDPYGDPGAATDPYGDPGAATDPYGDPGASGDFGGDAGGDFGGGDFGGDFSGGDFGGDF